MRAFRTVAGGTCWCLVLATAAFAKIDNGNDLALQIVTAQGPARTATADGAVGNLYFFRYLKVHELQKAETNGASCLRFRTQEPSSDMYVRFVVTKKDSLAIAAQLQIGDAVAVTGRVKAVDATGLEIVLDPVIVRYKDRPAPAAGKELLPEVDPNARYATDTSSGKESVTRGRDLKPKKEKQP